MEIPTPEDMNHKSPAPNKKQIKAMLEQIKRECAHVLVTPISSPDGIEYYSCVSCGKKFCKICGDALNKDGLCNICDNYLYDHE